MKEIKFFFDFISPYAYFAWKELCNLSERHEVVITPVPVVFGVLLEKWGQLGPAEIPPKRIHTFKDCYRYSIKQKIPFSMPVAHPFKPITALRLSLVEVTGNNQKTVIDRLFEGIWSKQIDGGDATALASVLSEAGLDGQKLIERTQESVIKDLLKDNTDQAIKRGVFGSLQ